MLQLDHVVLDQDGFRLTADWQVAQGETVAIIGPSGAGKSTLLATIAGFFAPSSGRILWAGQEVTAMAPGQRPFSILFQDQNLFPHLTIDQNLGLGLKPDLRLSAAERARIDAVLDRVGLAGMGPRRPAQLSGGQVGRAALARSLLRAKPVLLLDEPFAALGPGLKADMLALVAEITAAAGTTVLMVTHDPSDAERNAAQVVFVDQGQARPPVPTKVFFAASEPAVARYLGH